MKKVLLALLPLGLAAAQMNFAEPPRGELEWGFRPAAGECSEVTPSPFVWKDQAKAVKYELQYSPSADFTAGTRSVADLRWNVHCPAETMTPGVWYWRVRFLTGNGEVSAWSSVRRFEIAGEASANPKPENRELLARIPSEHPRIFLRPEELPKMRELAKGELSNLYRDLIVRADALLKDPPSTAEPPKYPEGIAKGGAEWQKIWWGNRMRTMKVLDAAADLGYAWRLSGDRRYGEAAKRLLMECALWDPAGATSIAYNDEAGMPYLSRFSRTYSYVFDLLSEAEKDKCREVVRIRGNEAYRMLYPRHFYEPYNSHKNRMWHFLGEAAVVFHGEIPESADWLDGAMNVYFCVYPVWGDDDGGWHEGIWYWREYLDRFFWWGDILRNTFNIDIAAKPFFNRTGYFALYQMPPVSRSGGFGDLGHLERNQHALTMKSLASLSGNPYFQWYADRIGPAVKEAAYIEFRRAANPRVAAKAPADLATSRCFRGNGLAFLNTDLVSAADNVQVLFKSSPTNGTASHGYDANNSFLLNMGGERLLIRSGQRDNWGSDFHRNWMWETKSENNITVDNIGQKKCSRDARGRIGAFTAGEHFDYVCGEAAESYEGRLHTFRRQLLFLKPGALLVVDSLKSAAPAIFNWHLHALNKMEINHQRDIRVHNGEFHCRVEFLHPANLAISQTDRFDPPPMPSLKLVQHHLTADTAEKSADGLFITVIRPYKSGESADAEIGFKETAEGFLLQIPVAGKRVEVTVSRKDAAIKTEWGDLK